MTTGWYAIRFWRGWLAGKMGMFCVHVGALKLARRFIEYEGAEVNRLARKYGVRR